MTGLRRLLQKRTRARPSHQSVASILRSLKRAVTGAKKTRRRNTNMRGPSSGEDTVTLGPSIEVKPIAPVPGNPAPPPAPPAPPAPGIKIEPTPIENRPQRKPTLLDDIKDVKLRETTKTPIKKPPYEPDDPLSKHLEKLREHHELRHVEPVKRPPPAPSTPWEKLMDEIHQGTTLKPTKRPSGERPLPPLPPILPPPVEDDPDWIDDSPLPVQLQPAIVPTPKRPKIEPVRPEKPTPQGTPVTQSLIDALSKRRVDIEDSDDEGEDFDDGYGFSHMRKRARRTRRAVGKRRTRK